LLYPLGGALPVQAIDIRLVMKALERQNISGVVIAPRFRRPARLPQRATHRPRSPMRGTDCPAYMAAHSRFSNGDR
jgi:hypothetical protein